jgi:phosphotriesterase-related protein
MAQIQTVLGTIDAHDLGPTLMHEHLMIGWPGWEADLAALQPTRTDSFKLCVDRLEELKGHGLRTLLDPCPIDLGRDVEFAAEVAQRAGVNLICATGLYKEDQGGNAYFRFRARFQDVIGEMAEIFEREIREGVGTTGIRAGVIKVATGEGQITPYEESVLRAAARAHKATGVPLTTHTEHGTMGPQQLDIFASEGVDLARVIVGHCCGNSDLAYHTAMLDRGCYIGFDRFGLEILQPDRLRKAALVGLIAIGFDRQIVLSHDSVWCWLGRPLPRSVGTLDNWEPSFVFREVVPFLRNAGVAQDRIDNLLIHNPRRYFGG